jgi:hypothetical protein
MLTFKLIFALLVFSQFSCFEPHENNCLEKIHELNYEHHKDRLEESNKSLIIIVLIPQIISIVCFLALLIIYASIGELSKFIQGKCWIHFLVNSLLNYLTIIFIHFYIFVNSWTWESCLLDMYSMGIVTIVAGSILTFTEFSLYFWLNLSFFEAFYMMK